MKCKHLRALWLIILVMAVSHAAFSQNDLFGDFDPKRIPVELQAWWFPNFGHIHAAARLPIAQEVSGLLNFDVRIVLHDNPSRLFKLRFDNESGGLVGFYDLNLSCPHDGTHESTCSYNIPVSIDTRRLGGNGWHTLRIRATSRTPDGNRYTTSSDLPLFVNNGGTTISNQDANRFVIGKGWYEGIGYANTQIRNVPITPISGSHTFQVRVFKPSGHMTVELDKGHDIDAIGPWPYQPAQPGTTLFDQDGDFKSFMPITIDTRRLSNGWHALQVRSTAPKSQTSQCSFCNGEINKLSGVAKLWFYVQNNSNSVQSTNDAAEDVAEVAEEPALPTTFALHQNYPNPFNPETTISYDLPKTEHVRLTIYNMLGHEVRTLLDAEEAPGTHRMVWDGLDMNGGRVSSGMYLLRMRAGDFQAVEKMTIEK